ncbi:MAG: hypothetical protein V4563_14580 [Pseudomonadota bacterium]
MIAVSSHKPFAQSAEIARNQVRAFNSWLAVFDAIIYFGASESALASPYTAFIHSTERPRIRDLMFAASLATSPACLINSDIVLAPNASEMLIGAMKRNEAATSFRYEFNPAQGDLSLASKVDNGLDLFLARPDVWRRCWADFPGHFRIGKPMWDSWLYMWMREHCQGKFADLSKWRLVYHPRHTR